MADENVISTPNEVKKDEAPHLTDAEIEAFHKSSRLQQMMNNRMELSAFNRMDTKPDKVLKPLKFNDQGKVSVNYEPKLAPVTKGNLRKGTLRNKKCSCGSGKKFKKCCLNSKIGG